MSYAERHIVELTTSASGAATGYTPVVTGRVQTIRYVKDNFADGVDVTITVESSGESILAVSNLNASATFAPRQPTHDLAGAIALYAGSGEAVRDAIVVAHDRIKIDVAEGGNTKHGTFVVVIH